jgi:hypothetical protein
MQLSNRSARARRITVRVLVRNHTITHRNSFAREGLKRASLILAVAALSFSALRAADEPPKAAVSTAATAVFWTDPTDWANRDLYYGIGGKDHEPHGPFAFVKEDLAGTNPKFVVTDSDGAKWKVKLGLEARPETVAARLVWAAGYFTNEDYFVPEMQVGGMPQQLHRGQKLIGPGGTVHNVRLKREEKAEKKAGNWQWHDSQFNNTREWNGLRTLMALINNWDLKDENNAIYKDGSQTTYMVSDLGASFGSAGRSWPRDRAKDNIDSYRGSVFIKRTHGTAVDFAVPARPRFVYLVNPKEYLGRVHLEYIGKNVPRADAKWLGQLLGRLSDRQIHDAFRAAGYSPTEIEAFSQVLKSRIAKLTDL